MHPLTADIQLFGKPFCPEIHDAVHIHIFRDVVVVGLVDFDFGGRKSVDSFPLGDIPQILQIFAGDIQLFGVRRSVCGGVSGILLDLSKGIAKSNAPIGSIEDASKRPLTLSAMPWPKL